MQAEGRQWHADVGFGWDADRAVPSARLRYTSSRAGGSGSCTTARSSSFRPEDGDWLDLYGFVPDPVPHRHRDEQLVHRTHPRSPFVTGLIAAAQRPDGARVSLSDWQGLSLSEETPAGGSTRPVDPGEVGELIATQFGLRGFDG